MKEIKFLKRILKKRKSFTVQILISFLITGNIPIWANLIENNDIILSGYRIYDKNLNNTGTISNFIDDFSVSLEGNGITSNQSTFKNLENLGLIKGYSKNGQHFGDNAGNGISAPNSFVTIFNIGNISGYHESNTKEISNDVWGPDSTISLVNTSNGISLKNYYQASYGKIFLNNLGNISGNASIKSSNVTSVVTDPNKESWNISSSIVLKENGNGILTHGNVYNKGIINGKDFLESGDITNKFSHIYSDNSGLSLGESTLRSEFSGNGISQIEKIEKNSGIFKGNGYYKSGNVTVIHKNNYDPNKVISSKITVYNSNNGIESSKLNLTNNEGIISGEIFTHAGSSYSESDREKGKQYNYATNSSINLKNSGNGVFSKDNIEDSFKNNGIVSGYTYNIAGIFEEKYKDYYKKGKDYILQFFSGNGLASENVINELINNGIIKGSGSAVAAKAINEIKNFGILAGREIFSTGKEIISNDTTKENYQIDFENGNVRDLTTITPTLEINKGIYIKLSSEFSIDSSSKTGNVAIDKNGNPKIESIFNGVGGEVVLEDGTKKVIINGQRYDENNHTTDQANLAKDSYIIANGSNYENNIINGAGINKGALVVKAGTSINDSIVNGYNTAIYLENLSQLTATNTIFNGGGLKNDVAVIKGSMGDNVASISGASIINGAVNLQDGNDTLSIANTVQINGELDGGTGNDILNLGETSITKVTPNLNILHDIKGFENVNTNGNITLFETTKITGADKINLESGNLVLRVDPTITAHGKVTGHALYENNGTLTSNGGNLIVGLNGLGEGTIISMGGTTITPDTDDSWWKDTDHIKTNSLVLDGKLSADGKDIYITVLESIPLEPSNPVPPTDPQPPINPPIEPEPPVNPPISPEPPVNPPISPESPIVIDSLLYEKLNKIYQSIVAAGEIGNLANTTLLENKTYNESLGGLLTILDQMYANNPYAYTVKSSRDSLKLFEDNMSYLTIKPKKDEMIVQGKAIYTGVKNDSGAYGKNYYGFDTGHRNYKTTTNTVGGLATFEYGLSDKTSVGVVLGGNSQDINFKGSSKIKGNSLYLGTFAKTDINNFKFMGGVGYQYTSADADRKVSNRYDSFSTGDRYDINSLNAFVEAKYIYNAEQDWTVEPKVRLSYYYIEQDKVNEGYTPGQISMRTDKINSNTADVETGVDFVKSLYLNNGKLKNILSLGVINTIGDKSKELNGYILGKEKDGKKFDIQGVELPKTSGKVSYSLELEQTNGMIYTAGVSLEFAKDYNRNVNVTVGIGYKF